VNVENIFIQSFRILIVTIRIYTSHSFLYRHLGVVPQVRMALVKGALVGIQQENLQP